MIGWLLLLGLAAALLGFGYMYTEREKAKKFARTLGNAKIETFSQLYSLFQNQPSMRCYIRAAGIAEGYRFVYFWNGADLTFDTLLISDEPRDRFLINPSNGVIHYQAGDDVALRYRDLSLAIPAYHDANFTEKASLCERWYSPGKDSFELPRGVGIERGD
jgi:hypothetical protein